MYNLAVCITLNGRIRAYYAYFSVFCQQCGFFRGRTDNTYYRYAEYLLHLGSCEGIRSVAGYYNSLYIMRQQKFDISFNIFDYGFL